MFFDVTNVEKKSIKIYLTLNLLNTHHFIFYYFTRFYNFNVQLYLLEVCNNSTKFFLNLFSFVGLKKQI